MKIAVVGGVTSTAVLVNKLKEHGFAAVHVFGYTPQDTSLVSGWTDLQQVAVDAGFAFTPFVRVNDCRVVLQAFSPDWIFAVGLSQLMSASMLSLPGKGSIGFHPTALPQGRGRAPIAWLVLEQQNGAATFFLMGEGVDDGPILAQVPFPVGPEDDAASVEAKVLQSEATALDALLPTIRLGQVSPRTQDNSRATFYGRRAPEDGWLDWTQPAAGLLRLVRASSTPHPGAYSFNASEKITVLAATLVSNPIERGVVGRILQCQADGSFVVQCGQGHLRVTQWQASEGWMPKVGQRLGFYTELEVHALRQRVQVLEDRLMAIERVYAQSVHTS